MAVREIMDVMDTRKSNYCSSDDLSHIIKYVYTN